MLDLSSTFHEHYTFAADHAPDPYADSNTGDAVYIWTCDPDVLKSGRTMHSPQALLNRAGVPLHLAPDAMRKTCALLNKGFGTKLQTIKLEVIGTATRKMLDTDSVPKGMNLKLLQKCSRATSRGRSGGTAPTTQPRDLPRHTRQTRVAGASLAPEMSGSTSTRFS